MISNRNTAQRQTARMAVSATMIAVLALPSVAGATGNYPDYTKQSSPACRQAMQPKTPTFNPSCFYAYADYAPPSPSSTLMYGTLPASQLELTQDLKEAYLRRIAANYEQQIVLSHVLNMGPPPLGQLTTKLDQSCDAGPQGFVPTLFSKAEQAGNAMASKLSPQASALYENRLALALVETALIKGKHGLANPIISGDDAKQLEQLTLLYPQVAVPKADEYGQDLLKEWSPTNSSGQKIMTGSWMGRNSYGLDAQMVRVVADPDDDSMETYSEQFLFPNKQGQGVAPHIPPGTPVENLREQLEKDFITKPLTPAMTKIVQTAEWDNINGLHDAISDICGMSFCDLANLDSATTAGMVAGESNSVAQSDYKKLLCTSCAVHDTSALYKFNKKYGAYVQFGGDLAFTGLCLVSAGAGCVAAAIWGGVGAIKDTETAFDAHKQMVQDSDFLSAGLISTEAQWDQMNQDHKKFQLAVLSASLSIVTSAFGLHDIPENLQSAKSFSAAVNAVGQNFTKEGKDASVTIALIRAARTNPTLRQELLTIGEKLQQDPVEAKALLASFVHDHGAEFAAKNFNSADLARFMDQMNPLDKAETVRKTVTLGGSPDDDENSN